MHKQSGFSLIELLLVLAIIAAIAVGAFIIYPKVQASRAASTESTNLSTIQTAIKGIYTAGRYGTLNNTVALGADVFPSSQVEGTSVINQWSGTVTAGPSTSAGAAGTATSRYFRLVYTDVPSNVCTKLAMAASANFGTIVIGTTIVQDDYSPTQVALNEASVVTACNAETTTDMIFVSN